MDVRDRIRSLYRLLIRKDVNTELYIDGHHTVYVLGSVSRQLFEYF
jgi:hypothetical protein